MFAKNQNPLTLNKIKGIVESDEAANGPQPELSHPEIAFVASGNTPDIELGAPPYDLNRAERRRN